MKLLVKSRETDEVEAEINFTPSELEMPGYLEHVERGYENTKWYTERA